MEILKSYYDHGVLDGSQSYYYKSGKPKKIINYKNGEFNGSYTTYYEDSIVKMSKFFKNGIIDGDELLGNIFANFCIGK